MPSGHLRENDGAYLVCTDCDQQVRSNEYHNCNSSDIEVKGNPYDQLLPYNQ